MVGVRAWLACGYFILGGASQGGGQAPAFRVARCRAQSLRTSGWVPSGLVGGSLETRMGPYPSRTRSIESSVVAHRAPSSHTPVLAKVGDLSGFHQNHDSARQALSGLDRSLGCPVSVHD